MPKAEIAQRGGVVERGGKPVVRTIRRGGKTLRVYVVHDPGPRGGRTVAIEEVPRKKKKGTR
jgi:hypothetical protein